MDGERIVFTEESNPHNYLKLVASGDVDEMMLEALEDYVKRQKRRLGAAAPRSAVGSGGQVPFMITQAQKEALREKGFEDDQIVQMTPEKAHQLLGILPPPPY
jgi:glucose/arabinose dehydrogenase